MTRKTNQPSVPIANSLPFPTRPPQYEQLEAMLPWAHMELSERDEGELVIYTGLTEDEETGKLVWMDGMEET